MADEKSMDGKDDDKAVKSPAEKVEDETPNNGDVVNAENIKATLANALKILEKYGIQAPAGASGLASSSVNGLNTGDLQRVIDQLAGAERAASGSAVQNQIVEGLPLVPFIGKKNENGIA
jgi:hypothetical protein